MLRDNLAGLIEPMVDRAGAHPLGDHHKAGQTGGCSRSTQVPIIALKRSWRKVFRWKTEQPTEKAKWSGFAVTTAAHDSRAVGTQYHSHRTIDPPMPQNIPAPKGRNLCTNGERRSPFHAEPRHLRTRAFPNTRVWSLRSSFRSLPCMSLSYAFGQRWEGRSGSGRS
jgi:hypothetical protein